MTALVAALPVVANIVALLLFLTALACLTVLFFG